MNTNNAAQQTTLSNTDLVKRIDDLINLTTLTRNSMNTQDGEYAAEFALKEMDSQLAELMNYFSDQAKAPATDKGKTTPQQVSSAFNLINDLDHSKGRACALLSSIILTDLESGFYSLNADLSAYFIAAIEEQVEKLHKTGVELHGYCKRAGL